MAALEASLAAVKEEKPKAPPRKRAPARSADGEKPRAKTRS
jgi:hypothetical protein